MVISSELKRPICKTTQFYGVLEAVERFTVNRFSSKDPLDGIDTKDLSLVYFVQSVRIITIIIAIRT
jgi:hypothetical protein